MLKYWKTLLAASLTVALLLTSCGTTTESTVDQSDTATDGVSSQVAGSDEMVIPKELVEEGMEPIYGNSLKDGAYTITVDSSSSMFNIVSCTLTVAEGQMTAEMTMGGTGYRCVYLGTGEEAVEADESSYIPYVENTEGQHTFTIPVEALNQEIDCAAFSKKKEKWYDRKLLFRADTLPLEAFAAGTITTVKDLGLEDGDYTVEVTLEGGSGRASVQSPAQLTVAEGEASVTLIWSSSNYDYLKVDGVQYEPVTLEGGSTFEIPVTCFDWGVPVSANTIAMSTPHEIAYTLTFHSDTLVKKQ